MMHLRDQSRAQGCELTPAAQRSSIIRHDHPQPTILEGHGIRLEPLTEAHHDALAAAAADGKLWELWFTSVPAPGATAAYIADALKGQRDGHMLPWAVRDLASDTIVGTTRYHDIVAAIDRVEIGYTWYAASRQRTQRQHHVQAAPARSTRSTRCSCKVVGLRTDNFNFRSQRAIEGIGAKKDGVIRHHAARKDGTVRDSVMYSILAAEWPDVRRHLELRLARHATAQSACTASSG